MAVGLNGSTDQLSRTANLPAASTAWSACGWALRAADRNDYSALCWLSGVAGAAYSGIGFTSDGTTLASFATTDEDAFSTQPTQGLWFKWAITQSGTTLTAYWSPDGSATVYTATSTAGNFTPTLLSFGNDGTGFFLNGSLAYVRAWQDAMNQAQFEAEWASTTTVRTTNHLWHWRLNNNTDTADLSANGYNPTVGGTLTTETGPSIGGGGGSTQAPRSAGFMRMLMNN